VNRSKWQTHLDRETRNAQLNEAEERGDLATAQAIVQSIRKEQAFGFEEVGPLGAPHRSSSEHVMNAWATLRLKRG
jgi:hypothetical protein